MVARPLHSRRGTSSLGCLVSLALFVGALYYGVHIGQVYLRYFELLDDMRTQAHMGANFSDNEINAHLAAQADSLLGESPRFEITRDGRRVTIKTEYTERVDLPFFKHAFVLRPHAEE
ncbi:MAG: hypothetical protein ACJ8DC_03825 [Gemmatimonadales bacterium]